MHSGNNLSGWLSAWICLETRGLQNKIMHSACCLLASGRGERDILDHAKLICTFSQPLQTLSLQALCKCMRECLRQVLTHMVARFTNSRLISPQASFKCKLCDTNSSDLSDCLSFAPFCICTAVPNGLPVLAFADSKRSHCKWIPNDSKTVTTLIRTDALSANIFLYHPSTKTGVSLDGKCCTAGIEKIEPWPRPSNFASRSIYLRQVSGQDGQGAFFVSSKTGSIGMRLCLETFHYQSLKKRLGGARQIAFVASIAFEASSAFPLFWADESWEHLLAETAEMFTATSRFDHFPHNTLGACCHGMHPVGCLKNICLNMCFTLMMSPCIWAV